MKKLLTPILCLIFGLVVVFLISCKKTESETTPTPPSPQQLTAYDNVVVVDSSQYNLDLSPALLSSGIYRFTASGAVLSLPVGAIIVGEQGNGFLRRVTASTSSGKQTTLQTQPASLDEVFSSGKLTLRASSDSLRVARVSSANFEYAFGNLPLYQSGPLNLTLRSGSVTLNPDWVIELGFSPQGTVEAKVATQNASFEGNLVFNVRAAQAATLEPQSSVLNKYKKDFTIKVPVVILGVPVRIPVVVRMQLDLNLEYSASVSAAIQRDISFSSKTTFDIGAAYANNQWQGIYNINPTSKLTLGPRSGQAKINVQMALIPKISFRIYKAVGPYASIGLQEELQGAVASPALDWDFRADAWLRATVGVTGSVLGKKLPDYFKSWDSDKLTYQSPTTLERTSGDNQIGSINSVLPIPIKVRVLDNNRNPEKGVPVYFTTTTGNGSASPSSILTDANGYAETSWTLGTITTAQQLLKATARRGDGSAIDNAPLDFAALASSDLQYLTNGSSKDWRATQVIGYDGKLEQSCNNIPFTMTFNISYGARLAQYIANGPAGACILNANSVTFSLGNARVLTLHGADYKGNPVDEFYQITRLTNNNLELSGITDPAKRISLVY